MTIEYQIVIAGKSGTGTTSAAKGVLKRLVRHGWKRVSPAAETFLRLARERYPDMKHSEAFRLVEAEAMKDLSIDLQIDIALKLIAQKRTKVIIDAQLGAMCAPKAMLVYLEAPKDVRYQRIATRRGLSYQEAIEMIEGRERVAQERHRSLYGITDIAAFNYHLRLSTEKMSREEVVEAIMAKFQILACQ